MPSAIAEGADLVIGPFDQRSRYAQLVDEKPRALIAERRDRASWLMQFLGVLTGVASRPPKSGSAGRDGLMGYWQDRDPHRTTISV